MTKRELMTAISKANEANAVELPKDVLLALYDYAEKELVLLDKRSESRRKAVTKKQTENAGLKNEVYAALVEAGRSVSIKDIMPKFTAFSTQKISAMMTQLVNDGRVIKNEEKNKTATYTAIKQESKENKTPVDGKAGEALSEMTENYLSNETSESA